MSSSPPSLLKLEALPNELLLETLLKVNNISDLLNLCSTNRRINAICEDDGFWHRKYSQDIWNNLGAKINLQNSLLTEGVGLSWKEIYQLTMEILNKNSPLSARDDNLGIIDQTGKLSVIGNNVLNQLGTIPIEQDGYKIATPLSEKVISVACQANFTLAVTEMGSLYYWGWNEGNYLKFPEENNYQDEYGNLITKSPQLVDLPLRALKVVAGSDMAGVILEDFSVYLLGDILKSKDERESYFDPFDREYIPKMIPPTKIDIKAVDLSLGHNRFSAIGIDHGLYFWGEPFLHTNSFESPYIDQPSLVPLPEKIQQISMGYSQLTVLTITGKVYEWNSDRGRGLYLFSESKNDPHLVFTKPSEILFPEIISSINSGGTSAAISKEGKLYMWGNNHFGQVSKSYPRVKILDIVPVSVGSKVKHLACADIFTSAVTENGEVLIWGEPLS